MTRSFHRFLLLPLLLPTLLFAGFRADLSPRADFPIALAAETDTVPPAKDFILTLTAESPADVILKLPDLRDRWQGFAKVEDFASERIVAGTRARQSFRWKLTPEPAARYRLAPFAVQVLNAATQAETDSFATRPVVLPPPPPPAPVTGGYELDPSPVNIPPTAKEIALWGIAVIAGLSLFVLLIYALRHIKRKVKEFRMSPAERAFAELDRLLKRDYIGKGLLKDFYVEITFIVRRYIERAYGLRAPNQTTDEFLAAARSNPVFSPDVLSRLAEFLRSADMIKFARAETSAERANEAVQSIRAYISADAAARPKDGSPAA